MFETPLPIFSILGRQCALYIVKHEHDLIVSFEVLDSFFYSKALLTLIVSG